MIRLAGMLLIEHDDGSLAQRRYVSEHSMRLILMSLCRSSHREGETQVVEFTAA